MQLKKCQYIQNVGLLLHHSQSILHKFSKSALLTGEGYMHFADVEAGLLQFWRTKRQSMQSYFTDTLRDMCLHRRFHRFPSCDDQLSGIFNSSKIYFISQCRSVSILFGLSIVVSLLAPDSPPFGAMFTDSSIQL